MGASSTGPKASPSLPVRPHASSEVRGHCSSLGELVFPGAYDQA